MNSARFASPAVLFVVIQAVSSPSSVAALPVAVPPRAVTLAERVAAQRAIETVYWRHRLWPKENAAPKPTFDTVLSDATIRAGVEAYLDKSNTLDALQGEPIAPGQLQAEMERMARDSKDPAMLRELFEALGNDPALIAECLARPTLTARLLDSGDANPWNRTERTLAGSAAAAQGSYSLVTPGAATCQDDTWTSLRSGEDAQGFGGHTAVWTGTEMIVWGGGSGGYAITNAGSRYDPALDVWTRTADGPNVPAARSGHTAVWTGTQMIVWGGVSGSTLLNSGGRYDPATNAWLPTSLGSDVPSPRNRHTAVWTGTEMIVWGGEEALDGTRTSTGGRYNPSADRWVSTSMVDAPTARSRHTAIWSGTKMVVWGGNDGSDVKTGGRYDPATDTWLPTLSTGSSVPIARSRHTAVWTGSVMLVWGGVSGSSCSSVGGRYDPVANTWLLMHYANDITDCRRNHSAVWTGSQMIVWGGTIGDTTTYDTNTGGKYNPVTDSWQQTSYNSNSPPIRVGHTAVWTGTEMIVWGGSGGPTGNRYDPATGAWRTTSPGAPTPRTAPAMVWTGAELVVWGGAGVAPKGDRYVPATDTWTFTAAAPINGVSAVGVWTGTDVIVWGTNATGARYSPAGDTWTPLSVSNAPAGRSGASAIWTGSKMVIWGGGFNTGGRYAPSSDTWSPTSTGANVPAARSKNTTVWTGSEMIVWGGTNGTLALTTGGRYDPETDSWRATSTSGSPAPRFDHTGVWTGTEMFVWGGQADASTYLQSGGRYSPITDSWLPTSELGSVPTERRSATAVWTGKEVIVWGGWSGSSYTPYTRIGGRYEPAYDSWRPTSLDPTIDSLNFPRAFWTGEKMMLWDSVLGAFYCADTCATYAPSSGPTLLEDKVDTVTRLTWSAHPEATNYDVIRGSLESLAASGGDFATSTSECLADELTSTSVDDSSLPSQGAGSWYLIRASNCRGGGTYDDGTVSQSVSRDAGILASPSACP